MKKLEAVVLADVSSVSQFAGFAGSLICRKICVVLCVSQRTSHAIWGCTCISSTRDCICLDVCLSSYYTLCNKM